MKCGRRGRCGKWKLLRRTPGESRRRPIGALKKGRGLLKVLQCHCLLLLHRLVQIAVLLAQPLQLEEEEACWTLPMGGCQRALCNWPA